jgi:hypothetical protein
MHAERMMKEPAAEEGLPPVQTTQSYWKGGDAHRAYGPIMSFTLEKGGDS